MGFWNLDEKHQLALLMAGLAGAAGTAGCDDKPVVVDPVPRDLRAETQVVDPLPPPDARRTERQITGDPAPRDFRVDKKIVDARKGIDALIADPLPPPDQGMVVDMLPPDASSSSMPKPVPQPPAGQRALPLARDLRTQIAARRLGESVLELRARPSGAAPAALRYSWKVSGGQLDRKDAAVVRWTLPAVKGMQIAQLTVRDGDRAVVVEVYTTTVK